MVKALCILIFFLAGSPVGAQSKKDKALIERTYLLSHTVFGSKDSATMEDLLARELSYGHSGGKIENREEALTGIIRNRSVYTDTAITQISVVARDGTAIVRYLFRAKENKPDGTSAQLNFSMMLVWIKEKGKWKLMGRQALRLAS